MDRRFIITVVCSSFGFIGAAEFAQAEPAGRYECNIVGAVNQDPIGDKEGHLLRSLQYSCLGVEGLQKGALYTGSSTSEWDGPQGTYFTGGGIIRAAGGVAVTLLTEGTGSVIMKDGKPAGIESSGKAVYRFASGTLAAFSGKAVRWETKPMGVGRFSLELMTDNDPGVIGMSRQ